MKTFSFLAITAIATLFFISCQKDSDPEMTYLHGAFIVNEGAYGNNNGSVSFYDTTSDRMVSDIFYRANDRTLGDIVQSLTIAGDEAYIVVNGSGKLEMVDATTFRSVTEPLYFSYPRYFMQVDNDHGYLSNGSMEGKLYVIDLNDHIVVDSIPVGMGPENMLLVNNNVYVANSGGWGIDSTISVLDIDSRSIVHTIVVGDVPIDMVSDADDNIWVQCKGYAVYGWDPPYPLISETDAKLVKISTSSWEVLWSKIIGKASDFEFTPVKMAIGGNGQNIYYLTATGVFKIGKDDVELPGQPLIAGSFYGMEINPSTGEIIVFESSFTGSGLMKIYSPGGMLTGTQEAGIAPRDIVFF